MMERSTGRDAMRVLNLGRIVSKNTWRVQMWFLSHENTSSSCTRHTAQFQQWLAHLDVINPRRRSKGLTWSSTFRAGGSAGSDVEGIVILDRLSQLVVMVACACVR